MVRCCKFITLEGYLGSQVAGGGVEVQMCSGSQVHGQSPQQESLLTKPLTSLGLSLFIFKMEGEEFIKAAIKGCLEIPTSPPGREALRAWEQGLTLARGGGTVGKGSVPRNGLLLSRRVGPAEAGRY